MSARARPKPTQAELPVACETLLSKAQICVALGICPRIFEGMRSTGEYPPPDGNIRSLVRWRTATHNAWIQEHCRKDGTR